MFVYNARHEDWIQENDESVFENFHSGECFQKFPDTAGKYAGYVWTQAVFVKKNCVFTNFRIRVDDALVGFRFRVYLWQ